MDLLNSAFASISHTPATRVTLLALVANAVCEALGRGIRLTSTVPGGMTLAQEIVLHDRVNLGIAAATERGLIVPNIPDAVRARAARPRGGVPA